MELPIITCGFKIKRYVLSLNMEACETAIRAALISSGLQMIYFTPMLETKCSVGVSMVCRPLIPIEILGLALLHTRTAASIILPTPRRSIVLNGSAMRIFL